MIHQTQNSLVYVYNCVSRKKKELLPPTVLGLVYGVLETLDEILNMIFW